MRRHSSVAFGPIMIALPGECMGKSEFRESFPTSSSLAPKERAAVLMFLTASHDCTDLCIRIWLFHDAAEESRRIEHSPTHSASTASSHPAGILPSRMWPTTRFTQLLGIRYPIIQVRRRLPPLSRTRSQSLSIIHSPFDA
jgi:hypothetical protein